MMPKEKTEYIRKRSKATYLPLAITPRLQRRGSPDMRGGNGGLKREGRGAF